MIISQYNSRHFVVLFLVNIRNFFVLAMRKEVMVKCVESKQVVETKPGVKMYCVEV